MPRLALKLSEVRAAAMKHPGLWQELVGAGTTAGEYLHIERSDFEQINQRRFGVFGLGNLIHAVATPIAEITDLILGTDLSSCGGCAERQLKLNK